jgi:hypothetical protein
MDSSATPMVSHISHYLSERPTLTRLSLVLFRTKFRDGVSCVERTVRPLVPLPVIQAHKYLLHSPSEQGRISTARKRTPAVVQPGKGKGEEQGRRVRRSVSPMSRILLCRVSPVITSYSSTIAMRFRRCWLMGGQWSLLPRRFSSSAHKLARQSPAQRSAPWQPPLRNR